MGQEIDIVHNFVKQNTDRDHLDILFNMSTSEVAKQLKVTKQTVGLWARKGLLKGTPPLYKYSQIGWQFTQEDVYEYLKQYEDKN